MLLEGILKKKKIIFLNKNNSSYYFWVYQNLLSLSFFIFNSSIFFFDRKSGFIVNKKNIEKKKQKFFFFFFKKVIKAKGWGYDLLFDKSNNFLTLKAERNIFHSIYIPYNIFLYFPQKSVLKKTIVNFYSKNYDSLTLFLSVFKSLKIPNIYTGKGLFFNLEIFNKKKFLKS